MSKHGTALTVGQHAELAAAVVRNLPRDIDPGVALGWTHNGKALAKALREALCPPATVSGEKSRCLHHRLGEVSLLLERRELFYPFAYFQDRDELRVWDGFSKLVLPATSPVASTPATTFTSYELVKVASDQEIRDELPDGHVFEDANVFCVCLATLINCQPGGKEGGLLNSGYANIFYVRGADSEVFAVHACWSAGRRGWSVGARRLDGGRWDAGCRVFASKCGRLVA